MLAASLVLAVAAVGAAALSVGLALVTSDRGRRGWRVVGWALLAVGAASGVVAFVYSAPPPGLSG